MRIQAERQFRATAVAFVVAAAALVSPRLPAGGLKQKTETKAPEAPGARPGVVDVFREIEQSKLPEAEKNRLRELAIKRALDTRSDVLKSVQDDPKARAEIADRYQRLTDENRAVREAAFQEMQKHAATYDRFVRPLEMDVKKELEQRSSESRARAGQLSMDELREQLPGSGGTARRDTPEIARARSAAESVAGGASPIVDRFLDRAQSPTEVGGRDASGQRKLETSLKTLDALLKTPEKGTVEVTVEVHEPDGTVRTERVNANGLSALDKENLHVQVMNLMATYGEPESFAQLAEMASGNHRSPLLRSRQLAGLRNILQEFANDYFDVVYEKLHERNRSEPRYEALRLLNEQVRKAAAALETADRSLDPEAPRKALAELTARTKERNKLAMELFDGLSSVTQRQVKEEAELRGSDAAFKNLANTLRRNREGGEDKRSEEQKKKDEESTRKVLCRCLGRIFGLGCPLAARGVGYAPARGTKPSIHSPLRHGEVTL